MKDNKLAFIDVDGTLVDSVTHIVPESTLSALHKLHEKDYLICIATGRSINSLIESKFDDQLFPWDGYVCNNGQMLYDAHKKRIFENFISKEAVLACIETGKQLNSPVLLESETTFITMKENEHVIEAHKFFNEPIPPIKDYENEDIIMMHAYAPKGYDFAPYRKIKGLDILPGNSSYADIVLEGFTKMNGIEIMLERLQKIGYLAIGDSLNDIDMLKHADISIAMGASHEEAKKVADFTTKNVMDDGIHYALQHLKIID